MCYGEKHTRNVIFSFFLGFLSYFLFYPYMIQTTTYITNLELACNGSFHSSLIYPPFFAPLFIYAYGRGRYRLGSGRVESKYMPIPLIGRQ